MKPPYIKRPTSGASASMLRRSSSVASDKRNRAGAARARVGARASLRQEKTSASCVVVENAALHRRPLASENSRSLPDGRFGALREEGRGMAIQRACGAERSQEGRRWGSGIRDQGDQGSGMERRGSFAAALIG